MFSFLAKYLAYMVGLYGLRVMRHIEAILSNVQTMETRAGVAGTKVMDSTWRQLQAHLPTGLEIPSREEHIDIWTEHIRFAQWMEMVDSNDRWPAFCVAARLYEYSHNHEEVDKLIIPFK